MYCHEIHQFHRDVKVHIMACGSEFAMDVPSPYSDSLFWRTNCWMVASTELRGTGFYVATDKSEYGWIHEHELIKHGLDKSQELRSPALRF